MLLVNLFESKVLDKPELSIDELAEKFSVSSNYIKHQLQVGINVELEHTSHKDVAREIALNHLAERPDYYEIVKRVGLEEDEGKLTFIDALKAFLPLAMEHLNLAKLPTIHLKKDLKTKHLPSFGQFSNDDNVINVDIENRHPNDVLRTLAHELTHYAQNLHHGLGNQSWRTGSPDEDQANAEAGVIMRKFNQSHPEFMRLSPIIISENFADGKNPGRKGLAKRSGVNCKQSVSKLRSIAKHSSGEKQRMAHWCANMKSGRAK